MNATEKLLMLQGDGANTSEAPAIGNTAAIPRLGVPALRLEDGPNGVADWQTDVTALPSSLTAVASWDTALVAEWATVMAQEQRGKGMNVMLGPGLNLARVPTGGRNFEYMGEDPVLASRMAAAVVSAAQGEGVVACAKHWVDNNFEGPGHNGRLSTSSDVGARAQRELYFAPFEAAIDAGVGAVMCGYNLQNGTFACENEPMLRKLKSPARSGGLNFSDGWVMSDWGADHGSVRSLGAGMDQSMGVGFDAATEAALLQGAVPAARIDDANRRILTALFRVGVFDRSDYGNASAHVDSAAHAATAQRAAEQSAVLLKNEDRVLPLSEGGEGYRIAVVGDDTNTRGGGSGAVWARHISTLSEELVSALSGGVGAGAGTGTGAHFLTRGADACTAPLGTSGTIVCNHSVPFEALGMGQYDQTRCTTQPTDADISAAAALARTADVAIVSVAVSSTEGYDRDDLSLGAAQDRLVRAVAAANNRTVVVVRCPGAVLMPWIDLPAVKAVLVQFLPGQAAGAALASLLLGKVNPSGKLPLSFPRAENQTWLAGRPERYPGVEQPGTAQPRFVATYEEGLEMGYRWFDAQGEAPLFEFGAGLSYTTFRFEPGSLHASPDGVSVSVTNTGGVAGAEVAQLYVSFPAASGEPPRLLKGFEKVQLEPGETKMVTFELAPRDLSVWDERTAQWAQPPGTFTAHVGSSSRQLPLSAKFEVPAAAAAAETRLVTISNVKPRLSTTGEIINAHDGTTRYWDGKFYYHAAEYREDPDPPQHGGDDTGSAFHNVSIWTSPDLSSGSWEFQGHAIECHETPGCDKLYRPHTVYNPRTQLYVQYWNTRSNTNGVATSPSPDGPFTFRGRMNISYHAPGDFDVFVDTRGDGAAYMIFAAVEDGHYIYIERLTDNFLNGNGEGVLIDGGHRDPVAGNLTAFPIAFNEAPLMFERKGKYYALFGHCCAFCYQGSGAFVFIADHPSGPWQGQPDPLRPGHPMDVGCADGAVMPTPAEAHTLPTTAVPTPYQGCQYNGQWPPDPSKPQRAAASPMRAQANFVIEVQTPDGPQYIWTGDRWMQAPDGLKSHEPQFWAPLEFTDEGHILPIKWVDSFDINVTVPQH